MTDTSPTSQSRYRKQMLFAPVGESGQQMLNDSSVLVLGCGALGTVIADGLVRSGIGTVRIVDRDFVELSNLQRQVLFDEQDVEQHLPKAIAAQNKLQQINSQINIEAVVSDVSSSNILELMQGMSVVIDGTDNFETRLLLNDASLETGIPWINGGCVGSHGQVMTIVPGKTPCFRCLLPETPAPGETATCETAGVLGPAVHVVASIQVTEAIRFLTGQFEPKHHGLIVIDLWEQSYRKLNLIPLTEQADCPACSHNQRDWLHQKQTSHSAVLCGRNAVQISPGTSKTLNLNTLGDQLKSSGTVTPNPFLIRFRPSEEDCEFHLFPDGRAIIQGTEDPSRARTLYAKYIGT